MRITPLLLAALLPLTASAALESWTGPDGQKVQAEFIRRAGDYLTFQRSDGGRYLLPIAKLNETERAKINTLTGHAANDTAEPAAATTTAATDSKKPAPAKPTTPAAAPAAAALGKALAPLSGKLVQFKGSTLVPVPDTQLASIRYLAVYYSAHWCPPCRAFTPKLVAAYKEIKADHPEFEIIFVSSDRDEKSMRDYMSETGMTWLAVRYDRREQADTLERPPYENGIPNLVFMTADGKELATSFTANGNYSGPVKVLAAIQQQFKK